MIWWAITGRGFLAGIFLVIWGSCLKAKAEDERAEREIVERNTKTMRKYTFGFVNWP